MSIDTGSGSGGSLSATNGSWTFQSLAGIDDKISAPELLQFAQSFDKNGNGKLGGREMRSMTQALAGLIPGQGNAQQPGPGNGLAQLWNNADADGNGALSASEAKQFARSLLGTGSPQQGSTSDFPQSYKELAGADGKLDQSEQDALLQIADTNQDGKIDAEESKKLGEFLAGIGESDAQDMPGSFDEATGADGRLGNDELAKLASLLDPNKNGLDASEAKKLAKLLNQLLGQADGANNLAQQLDPAMQEADSDGDGAISKDELSDLLSSLMDGSGINADETDDGADVEDNSDTGDGPANFGELAGVDKALSKGELKGFGEGLGLDLSKPLGQADMKKLGQALLKVLG